MEKYFHLHWRYVEQVVLRVKGDDAKKKNAGSAFVLTGVSIFTLVLRHHLFVWSVFAPRYMYAVLGTFFEVLRVAGLLFGSVLRSNGTISVQ